jgi:serine/threonine protein kinase
MDREPVTETRRSQSGKLVGSIPLHTAGITEDGTLMLLDFGVAKILNSGNGADHAMNVTGLLAMTPAYASPEQLRGEDSLRRATCIRWACCCTACLPARSRIVPRVLRLTSSRGKSATMILNDRASW